jgi:hypothetical protein
LANKESFALIDETLENLACDEVTGFANIECTVCDEAYFCYNVSH